MQAQARALTVGQRYYPIVLPNVRDPRLHVAAVIITIHVLGQIGLHFVVSIPQILAAILTCAVLEIAITFHQTRTIVWPASALLTGSGVGLILRVVGTPPNDHASTFAVGTFAAVGGLSLLSKYVIRYRGSPLFNPSNIGLVVTFIVLGESRVEPLDFWWTPPTVWLAIAYAVILTGGLLITRRLGLMALAVTFWVSLLVSVGVLAASGHCITANWAFAPVCGVDFWRVVVTSPELLIFLFFMITDPRTVPTGRVRRIVFGALVAVLATLLMAPQTTEFGAKVGLLGGLTLVCAARPVFDRLLPRPDAIEDNVRRSLARLLGLGRDASTGVRVARLGLAALAVSGLAVGITLAGSPARGAVASAAAMVDLDTARMNPATFPTISIESAVTDWDPTLAESEMRGIVLIAAQNLDIENEALRRGDPSLLTQVDHGDRLAEMQERVRDSVATGTISVDRYQPDSVNVSLLRPFGKQDGLSLGLTQHGSMISETYDASGHLLSRARAPFACTFVVRRSTGARWLTVAILPGDSDATPAN